MTKGGAGVLLVAMAIQGLTPDCGSLASSWLLRVVSAWSIGGTIGRGDPPSRPSPLRDDDAGDPDEIWGTVAAKSAVRVRLDDDSRFFNGLLPADLRERPARPACRSPRLPGPALRGPGGLIASLCRFRC